MCACVFEYYILTAWISFCVSVGIIFDILLLVGKKLVHIHLRWRRRCFLIVLTHLFDHSTSFFVFLSMRPRPGRSVSRLSLSLNQPHLLIIFTLFLLLLSKSGNPYINISIQNKNKQKTHHINVNER